MDDNYKRGVLLIDEMKLTPGTTFNKETLEVEGIVQLEENEVNPEANGKVTTTENPAVNDIVPDEVHPEVGDDEDPDDPSPPPKKRKRKTGSKNQPKKAKPKKTRKPKKPTEPKRPKVMTEEEAEAIKAKNFVQKFGDHALVISYQPFMGKWVQSIACFLTRGNANATTLSHLILEATNLVEESGLKVDGVVTDGASWNRSMWKKFGVSEDNPRATHPCDTERHLWFISDFPHLLKCMRNCMVTQKKIETAKGTIDIKHWEAVVREDEKGAGLKRCPRLTESHLNPGFWEKMNVAMAWQFWSLSAASGMQSYREDKVADLSDCDATVEFVKKVNSLADAMNSNTPRNALKPGNKEWEAIESFLEEFKSMKAYANDKLKHRLEIAAKALEEFQNKNRKVQHSKRKRTAPPAEPVKPKKDPEAYIFSESSDSGLIISLQATMELCKFLVEKCGYHYFMTARINQDALERFFGMVRQSAGQNTHPEPKVFAQLFRLLSLYSLVRPLKGSNITGGEMLHTLLNLEDFRSKKPEERRAELDIRLDSIIIDGAYEMIPELISEAEKSSCFSGINIDDYALQYVGGFTARHCERFVAKCKDCETCLKKSKEEINEKDRLIVLKSKGYLMYPTDALVRLLKQLEYQLLQTYESSELNRNFIFHVMDRLQALEIQPIGCPDHCRDVTKSVMKFYLITRMHFFCRQWNNEAAKSKRAVRERKKLKKQAHLT